MSEQQDQPPNAPSQPTAGDAESSSSDISYDDYMIFVNKINNKRTNLEEFELQTYYNVLHFFKAETRETSNSKMLFTEELRKGFKIPHKTCSKLEKKIKDEPLVVRWRPASVKKEENKDTAKDRETTAGQNNPVPRVVVKPEDLLQYQERMNAAPATIPEENAEQPSSMNAAPATIPEENAVQTSSMDAAPATIPGENAVQPSSMDAAPATIPGENAEQPSSMNTAPATVPDEHAEQPSSMNAAPATIPDENTTQPSSSLTSEDSLVPSWGQVSPESLVDRWVEIKMPGEAVYAAFHIKNYDAETEMHHLVTNLFQKTYIDSCDWIDIRYIPAEDIVWIDGHPGFPVRKCSLKPGETILRTTSTSQDKKQVKEVGQSASGIPIIKKVDRGKGIARG